MWSNSSESDKDENVRIYKEKINFQINLQMPHNPIFFSLLSAYSMVWNCYSMIGTATNKIQNGGLW